MSASAIRPMLEPDPEQMRRHLEHLFEGDLDGCQDGAVELAWSDAVDGRLRHAALFGTDELDELVERADAENRVPNQNIYVGQALRRPGTAPGRRCGDADFYALTAFYVDLDDDVLATARTSYRHRGCPPTAVVVTGRHPHLRAQMLWRLETPERDPEVCRRQNRAMAIVLGGDPSVANPARVLRLGGSVAWPAKPGRVLERTSFQTFDDGRPRLYYPGQLPKAFPPDAAAAAAPSTNEALAAATEATRPSLQVGSVSVDTALAAVRAGDRWHDNLVRLTGHWIARGWSDAEILTAAEALTLPGYTVADTRAEVSRMIAGGRAKWNVPNPSYDLEDVLPPAPLAPAFVEDLDVAMLPRRRWLVPGALLRGALSVLVAPPGVGKSTLGIALAASLVTGRTLTGHDVRERAKAWVYNNEDDADELERRLAAVLQHGDVPLAEVRGRLALNSGADRPLLVARAERGGAVVRLPDVDACIEHVRAHAIGLLLVDPFVETHEVDENANEQIKAVAVMFREIARKGDCAVLLVHHTAKPPQGASDGHAGNLNTARGASALVGVARIVQTLFAMSPRDGERYGIGEDERRLYVRLDDAKANVGLVSDRARWFRRVGVTIANGDEVGVLAPEELEPAPAEPAPEVDDFQRTIIACLLARVPEAEITVNAAAKRLAWGEDGRFARYRQSDERGNQRVSRTLRAAIAAACRRRIRVVSEGKSQGFTCDELSTATRLRRFEEPATATDIASQRPEFEEDPWT